MPRRILQLLLIVCLLFAGSSVTAQNNARLHFRITLSKEVAPNGTSGRLLVLMTDSPQPQQMVRVGFVPGSTWVAAMEITNLAVGATIEFDPDANAYPRSFSQAKPGTYQVMALLDVN